MYVYRTTYFERSADNKGILPHIERLCAELETMKLDEVQARFERVYPYLKRKEGNLRLIARIRRIGNDYILCWLKIFRRGDRDYLEFLREREKFQNRGLEKEVDDRLRSWLKQQKADNGKNQPQKEHLTEEMRRWLTRPGWEMDRDGLVIYETETWIKQFRIPEISRQWAIYHRIISKLAHTNITIGGNTVREDIKLIRENDCYILASRINTTDPPLKQILFLIAPMAAYPTETEIARFIADLPPEPLQPDHITSRAKRAYPDYLLADEQMWLAIEQEETANLALSAEEERILHCVSTTEDSLPLFLNGPAGSGKSTMLFHLFADYCYRHLSYSKKEETDPKLPPMPLFLAYNQGVTELAKERVMALLVSHHRFLVGEIGSVPDISPFFQPFRPFLLNLLPPKERQRFRGKQIY